MHLRAPTWKLRKSHIDFTMADNCFTAINSFEIANKLAADINAAEIEQRLNLK